MKIKKKKVLNVPISLVTRDEALDVLLKFLKQSKYHMVFTPNPEMVMAANRDKELMMVLRNADLVVPDGIGIILVSLLDKVRFKERVAGCDLFVSLFKAVSERGGSLRVYMLGAKPGVAEKAKENLERRYPGVSVVGLHDGYFDPSGEKLIIKHIQSVKPDLLLVGLNFSRQEKWIYAHRKRLPVRIAAGVGGSIDIYAGVVKRAPMLWQRLGLEWLYRLISEPSRAVRMLQLPRFVIKSIANKYSGSKL